MITKTDQQIQIINSNRSAKSTDRYLDPAGNIWVGSTNGRLIIPPIVGQINQPGNSNTLQERVVTLEDRPTGGGNGYFPTGW